MEQIPEIFAIRMGWRGSVGFGLFRTYNNPNETDINNNPIVVISRVPHDNLFYNIMPTNQNNTWQRRCRLKQGGNIRATFDWKYNGENLENEPENKRYPILKVSPVAALPTLNTVNFIPIVERPLEPAEVEEPEIIPDDIAPLPQPVVQPLLHIPIVLPHHKYPILDIPQHAIRCILQGAVIMGEICPISNEDIDIDNGAVTTCFHIFDRVSIERWLNMPNTRDKCPICNSPCNVYSLNDR